MMDIVAQRMLASHRVWLEVLRRIYGVDAGTALYAATCRFMMAARR